LLAYDPAFAYEVAVIVQDGLRRMYQDHESVFYYLTLYNQSYPMPALPAGADEGVLKGLHRIESREVEGEPAARLRPQLFGSGPLIVETLRAQNILAEQFNLPSDAWSATSYCQLRRDALAAERWNRLHPDQPRRESYLEQQLGNLDGPFVAVTDSVTFVPEQIRRWVPGGYVTLGTDGFGRSDTKKALRRHFEIDAEHIVLAALSTLAEFGQFESRSLTRAIEQLEIDPDQPDPATA
ncbi:MAG: pyruvate dehydrogenase (acetyl-transferring), homodimeric type, partial [Planctomycetes bacterium]|nr:pyruvate dehydrogenase (acetyl-transferring), homodimeric type [Planctomycetota bacterium]